MSPSKLLDLAAKVSRLKDDTRTYFHGCVGVRKDGVIVSACNGTAREQQPKHHAEARVLRKMGKGGTLYVVRTTADGKWADSHPCVECQKRIRSHKVKIVYFSGSTTDGNNAYGSWEPKTDRWVLIPTSKPATAGSMHSLFKELYKEPVHDGIYRAVPESRVEKALPLQWSDVDLEHGFRIPDVLVANRSWKAVSVPPVRANHILNHVLKSRGKPVESFLDVIGPLILDRNPDPVRLGGMRLDYPPNYGMAQNNFDWSMVVTT